MQGWEKLKENILQSKEPSKRELTRQKCFTSNVGQTRSNSVILDETNHNSNLSPAVNGPVSQELIISDLDESSCSSDESIETVSSPSVVNIESSDEESNDSLIETPILTSAQANDRTQENMISLEHDQLNLFSPVSSSSIETVTQVETAQKQIDTQTRVDFSTRSSDPTLIETEDISDDDIVIDQIYPESKKPIKALVKGSFANDYIPITKTLNSCPGSLDDLRDLRFLEYEDENNLCLHLKTCLSLDRESLPPLQPYAKVDANCLNKIFRLGFFKSLLSREKSKCYFEKRLTSLPLSVISSSTATSFKTDWNVNRRSSSSKNRTTPNNLFHILQLNPKTRYSETTFMIKSDRKDIGRVKEQFEQLKTVLARTYCPELYFSIENEDLFGSKRKLVATTNLIGDKKDSIEIKEMPVSPENPPSSNLNLSQTFIRDSRTSIHSEPRFSREEINDPSELTIRDSIVLLSPAPLPIGYGDPISDSENENSDKIVRKRKYSKSTNSPLNKKRKASAQSPVNTTLSIIEEIDDLNNLSSEKVLPDDEGIILDKLPEQTVVKNGLRSNFYKRKQIQSPRSLRRKLPKCKSNESLPPPCKGLFESIDETSSHIDYVLPNDIYCQSKQAKSSNTTAEDGVQQRKKKFEQRNTKPTVHYQKIDKNIYTEQTRRAVLSANNAEKHDACLCKPNENCAEGRCLNRMVFTECSNKCPCGNKCTNQRIQKGLGCKDVEIFSTGKYGQGVRATSKIEQGTFICEYVGEIINEDEFLKRMSEIYSREEHHYTMKLTQNLMIDAYRKGNIARFVNHSCSPNCEIEKWNVDGLPCLCLFARRSIEAGEEITYDYKFQSFNTESRQPCYCGSDNCRRFLMTKTENRQSLTKTHRLSSKEKNLIVKNSIFLLRNVRRVKEFLLRKKKSEIVEKEEISSICFPFQKFYHRQNSPLDSKKSAWKKNENYSQKVLFDLFYNEIRRSHFFKSGRIHREIIDPSYHAQLVQLTLLLEEIFEKILRFRSSFSNCRPSKFLLGFDSDLSAIQKKLRLGKYFNVELFEKDFLDTLKTVSKSDSIDDEEKKSIVELKRYFLEMMKQSRETVLKNISLAVKSKKIALNVFEEFLGRFHAHEVHDGLVRRSLFEAIFQLEEPDEQESPIVHRLVTANSSSTSRSQRTNSNSDIIVHCRCGSNFEETSLVQCYACQLWQHVSCVTINEPTQPFFCFECDPLCEKSANLCQKVNVFIQSSLSPCQTIDNPFSSYSTLTRPDGFIVRTNESYFVPKQNIKNLDPNVVSPAFDILCVERLWIDDRGVGQAAGFYYIRPNETFHEPSRRFFHNEVFRIPSSDDPLPIDSFVRPCYVVDLTTFRRGRPISDNVSQVLHDDMFICEFRVDRSARNFSKIQRAKLNRVNTKSYCFDDFIEPLTIRRDYKREAKQINRKNEHQKRPSKKSDEKCSTNEIRTRRKSKSNSSPSSNVNFPGSKSSMSQEELSRSKEKISSKSTIVKHKKRTIDVTLSSDDESIKSLHSIDETPTKTRKRSK